MMLGQAPSQWGYSSSRWTLSTILSCCDWLKLSTLGGLCRLLERLSIGLKRGRYYVHSPDPDYADKVAYVRLCQQMVINQPQQYVLVYLDEFSFYRQPSLERDYSARQRHLAPLGRRSYHSNTVCRGIGALNAFSG